MWIKRRYYQYSLIRHGVTTLDKIKLLILAIFFTLPNKLTNMNAQTPQPLINLTKNLRVKQNGTIWHLTHPRQIYMISKGYEKNISHYFNQTGNTFLDIGANIGKYSIQLADNFKQIYSFEPVPETYKALKKNIETNNINNITPINYAAWNKQEQLTFYIKNNPGGNSSEMLEQYHNTITVEAIKLDTLLKGVSDIDFVKIDVEGAELQTLQGMTELIQLNKPVMVIEILEENEDKVYEHMDNSGYYLIQKQNRNHLWEPRKIDSSCFV